jgi:hypothetical protein
MNWWLVANRLKHGMVTVRPRDKHHQSTSEHAMADHSATSHADATLDSLQSSHRHHASEYGTVQPRTETKRAMLLLSFTVLVLGMIIGWLFGG